MESKFIAAMIFIGNKVGTVTRVNMYNDDNIFINGVTEDGKTFSLSLIKESGEQKDA